MLKVVKGSNNKKQSNILISNIKFTNSSVGITLVALIITIIVLLILAAVSLNMIIGDNEIIGKANWTKFLTEYDNVKEAVRIYELNETAKAYGKKGEIANIDKVELASTVEIETKQKIYPIDIQNGKVENSSIEETLKDTIKTVENIDEIIEEKVNLYKIDMNTINLDIKNEYVVNIETGEIYKLKGVKYQGKTYHRPDYGVKKDGTVEENKDTADTIYLKIEEIKQLTTKLKDGAVEWSTSDESVVTVDQTGKITGIAKGKATITISYKIEDTGDTEPPSEGDEEGSGTGEEEEETATTTQSYTIIVEEGIPENFTLTLEDKTIGEYETVILEAKIEGIKVGTGYLEWVSSDESVVKVDTKGKIKGLKQGEAQIICKWKEDERKTATCKVTVKASDTLVLDKTQINIAKLNPDLMDRQQIQIIAKYKGEEVTNIVTWKSENENLVTVDKGMISAKEIGTTEIIAEYEGERAICKVTVKEIVTQIYKIEDLKNFAIQVYNGEKYEKETIELMNDLDFKNEEDYSSRGSIYNMYFINQMSWDQIGESTSKYFCGTFDGGGNSIANLYINTTQINEGLFGYSNGGTFKDLTLKDVNITSNKYQVGGILGYGMNVNISNCKITGNINSTGHTNNFNRTGGIVGLIGATGANISNCVNEATISGSLHCKGGIVGEMFKGTITNCVNKGKVVAINAYRGGIVGRAGYGTNANYTVIIDNCKNYGEIEGGCYVGGIAGSIQQGSNIKNCTNYNTGTVKSTGYNSTTYYDSEAGGIVGIIFQKGENKVENCNNYANVSGKHNGVGGIIGTSMKGTVANCKNEGEITGAKSGTGGIVGRTGYYSTTRKIYAKSIIEKCENKGVINSTGYSTGGITGINNRGSEIKNCNNYANVISTGKDSESRAMVGGIVGNQTLYAYNNIGGLIENCNNYGNIEASYYYCGGIVGWHQRGSVKNCTNEGKVTSERNQTGGISGATGRYDNDAKINGTIEDCLNKGDVTISGTGASAYNAGGITGLLQYGSSITKCGNTGNITTNGYVSSSDKTSRTGGIVGIMSSYGANKVTYCYNTGNVTAAYKYIGGITGYMYTASAIIDHCYSKGTITGPANIGGIVGYKRAGTVTQSYYLQNSVNPTIGAKTEEGEEKSESEIDSYIKSIK